MQQIAQESNEHNIKYRNRKQRNEMIVMVCCGGGGKVEVMENKKIAIKMKLAAKFICKIFINIRFLHVAFSEVFSRVFSRKWGM